MHFSVESPSISPLNLANTASSSNMSKSKSLSQQSHWHGICLQVWTSPGKQTEINVSIHYTQEHNSAQRPWLQQTSPSLCQLRILVTVCYPGTGATKENSCMQKIMNWCSLFGWSLQIRWMKGLIRHRDDSHISLSKADATEKLPEQPG